MDYCSLSPARVRVESPDVGLDTNNPKFHIEDRRSGDEKVHVWLEKVRGMYEYWYNWKLGSMRLSVMVEVTAMMMSMSMRTCWIQCCRFRELV